MTNIILLELVKMCPFEPWAPLQNSPSVEPPRGARAKAVIAWNRKTNGVRSGQGKAGDGFEYWLLKIDGVTGNRDKRLTDPQGYGAIEYAYYLMALDAGIQMSDCRLLEENGRRHFMTKRSDRLDSGEM